MTEILFTTVDLSKMLRVGTTTIKRWTDEKKLACFKTPGGHRKFKAEDVYDFLQKYEYQIPIQQIYEAMATDEGVIRKMVREKEYQTFISVCFSGALKGEKDEVRNLFLELYQNNLPLAVIFDEVLRPTLRRLADINASKIRAVEFQLALTVLISAIDKFNDVIIKSAAKKGEEILCLSAGNSYVEVELKALQTLFESKGNNVINLMPRMENDMSLELITVKEPKQVCLWVSKSEVGPELDGRVRTIFDIVHQYGGNMILGGEIQLVNPGSSFIEGRDIVTKTFSAVAAAFSAEPHSAEPVPEAVKKEAVVVKL